MKKFLFSTGALYSVFFNLAQAQTTVQQYEAGLRNDASKLLMQTYISGQVDGENWAIADQKARGQALSYCLPDSLSLSSEDDIDILNQFLQEHWSGVNNEAPIGAYMFFAMKEKFRCK